MKLKNETILKYFLLTLLIFVFFIFLIYLTTQNRQKSDQFSQNSKNAETAIKTSLPQQPFVLNIEIFQNKFFPEKFVVPRDQEVELNIISMEAVRHHFIIELGFQKPEIPSGIGGVIDEAGETLKLRFKAPSVPGEYKFYCLFHREEGEEGVMVVE